MARSQHKPRKNIPDFVVLIIIISSLIITNVIVSSELGNTDMINIKILNQDSDLDNKELQRVLSTTIDDVCDDCDDDDGGPSANKKPIAFIYQIDPNPGHQHELINFEGYGEDSDGEIISYNWVSDIDGNLSNNASFSSSSLSPGIHLINFSVKDNKNAWSDPDNVSLEIIVNEPPNEPFIAGEIEGKTGEEIEFKIIATDPEEHDISFYVDWGDGFSDDWSEPYNSDEEVSYTHSWDTKGDYLVKAKARDIYGEESDWGTLEIKMSKSRLINQFLWNMFQNFWENFIFLN
jgi:plastocyanin